MASKHIFNVLAILMLSGCASSDVKFGEHFDHSSINQWSVVFSDEVRTPEDSTSQHLIVPTVDITSRHDAREIQLLEDVLIGLRKNGLQVTPVHGENTGEIRLDPGTYTFGSYGNNKIFNKVDVMFYNVHDSLIAVMTVNNGRYNNLTVKSDKDFALFVVEEILAFLSYK